MTYETAWHTFYEEFVNWLYENFMIGNGEMLIKLEESPAVFENFMREHHPEIGELQ